MRPRTLVPTASPGRIWECERRAVDRSTDRPGRRRDGRLAGHAGRRPATPRRPAGGRVRRGDRPGRRRRRDPHATDRIGGGSARRASGERPGNRRRTGCVDTGTSLRFSYGLGPDSLKAIVHPPRSPVWTMRRSDGSLVVDQALHGVDPPGRDRGAGMRPARARRARTHPDRRPARRPGVRRPSRRVVPGRRRLHRTGADLLLRHRRARAGRRHGFRPRPDRTRRPQHGRVSRAGRHRPRAGDDRRPATSWTPHRR